MKTKILSVWFAVLLVTPMWGQDAPVKKMKVYQDCAKNGAITSATGGTTLAGYTFVDLGLSVYWATCNIGATSPEQAGNFYMWGEATTHSDYSLSKYDHYFGSQNSYLRYSTANNVLEPKDDTAHRIWAETWRMPTKSEAEELMNQCTWTWTTLNDVNGFEIVGPNGNSIFLPAAGWMNGASLGEKGTGASIWSSTQHESTIAYAYRLRGYWDSSKGTQTLDVAEKDRYRGYSVRPVMPKPVQ